MNIIYRRWSIDDLTSVSDVIIKTWLDAYSSFIPKSDLMSYYEATYNLDALRKLYHDPAVNGYVAEVDGNVVGCVRTKYDSEQRRHYVSSFYILPQYQRKGIGRNLMLMAADEAKVHNLDRVWIGVMVDNHAGLDWYQKMGYQAVEKAPFTMGKTTVNHYIGYVPLDSIEAMKKQPTR